MPVFFFLEAPDVVLCLREQLSHSQPEKAAQPPCQSKDRHSGNKERLLVKQVRGRGKKGVMSI